MIGPPLRPLSARQFSVSWQTLGTEVVVAGPRAGCSDVDPQHLAAPAPAISTARARPSVAVSRSIWSDSDSVTCRLCGLSTSHVIAALGRTGCIRYS